MSTGRDDALMLLTSYNTNDTAYTVTPKTTGSFIPYIEWPQPYQCWCHGNWYGHITISAPPDPKKLTTKELIDELRIRLECDKREAIETKKALKALRKQIG